MGRLFLCPYFLRRIKSTILKTRVITAQSIITKVNKSPNVMYAIVIKPPFVREQAVLPFMVLFLRILFYHALQKMSTRAIFVVQQATILLAYTIYICANHQIAKNLKKSIDFC